jgi:hypothetical protein
MNWKSRKRGHAVAAGSGILGNVLYFFRMYRPRLLANWIGSKDAIVKQDIGHCAFLDADFRFSAPPIFFF